MPNTVEQNKLLPSVEKMRELALCLAHARICLTGRAPRIAEAQNWLDAAAACVPDKVWPNDLLEGGYNVKKGL